MALEEFRNKFGTAFTEYLGTLFLVLTIQLAAQSPSPLAPLAIGLVLVAIVYAAAPISGAHVNPAVTVSIFLRGKIAARDALMYWVAQLLGGVSGALVGAAIAGGAVAPAPGKGTHFLQAFLAELVFTAVLCFVVLAVATSSAAENNSWYGLAIGVTVFGGAVCVGPISGASFNPAVTIGLCMVKNSYMLWKNMYALWTMVAQICGGVLGTLAYYICAPAEFEHFGANLGDLATEAQDLLPGASR